MFLKYHIVNVYTATSGFGWLRPLQVQLEAENAEKDEARRKRRASNCSPQIASSAPSKYVTSPAMSSKSSPKMAAISPFLQAEKSSPVLEVQSAPVTDWVEVRGNSRARKDASMASPKLKASEAAQMPPAAVPPSPKGGKKGDSLGKDGKDGKGKGKTSLMSLDESASSRHLRLADFIKPQTGRGKGKGGIEAKRPESDAQRGPSAILVSAVQSAGAEQNGAKWAVSNDTNPKLSQILEEDKGVKEAKKKNPRKPEAKVMTCSWGRDALPSEQSKNQSIVEIQQEEELLREHDEILEIEAPPFLCSWATLVLLKSVISHPQLLANTTSRPFWVLLGLMGDGYSMGPMVSKPFKQQTCDS